MMKKYYCIYKSEIGDIVIFYNEIGVTGVSLPYDDKPEYCGEYKEDNEILKYFRDYFSGETVKPLNLDIKVTDFQKKVFDVLTSTKRGTYLTYGDVARIIGCASPRAIGQALKRNPCPVIIPCHRVVGKGWDGGFGGDTDGVKMDIKKYFLNIEANTKDN